MSFSAWGFAIIVWVTDPLCKGISMDLLFDDVERGCGLLFDGFCLQTIRGRVFWSQRIDCDRKKHCGFGLQHRNLVGVVQ